MFPVSYFYPFLKEEKSMKKLISLVLVAIMALSLFGTAMAEDELITLKILAKNDFSSDVKTKDWEKYAVSDEFKARLAELGIAIEFECIDNAQLPNVVRTRMASGVDLPDIIAVAFDGDLTASEIEDWGMNGLIIPASELMEKYDEDGSIRAFYDAQVPSAYGSNTSYDGNMYWFCYLYAPKTIYRDTGKAKSPYNFRTPSIRQDWVEKVGEEMKIAYTPDELFDLLVKIQEGDANGNGLKDEVVCVPIDSLDNGFTGAFGLSHSLLTYVNKDGVVDSNFYHEEELAAYLTYMHKLYDAGLYDTAAFGADLFSGELITQNKAAVTFNYASWSDYEKQIGLPDAQYTPFIVDDDADLSTGWACFGDVAGGTFNQYFVTSACKHPEAALKLFDFIYTMDYALLNQAGPTGTYIVDEQGVVDKDPASTGLREPFPTEGTDAEKLEWNHKYETFFSASAGLYGLPAIVVTPGYGYLVNPDSEEYIKVKQRVVSVLEDNADTVWFEGGTYYARANAEEKEIVNEVEGVLTTYAKEMLVDMILGNRDIAPLHDGIEELKSLGLDRYIEVYAARRERFLAAQQ